MITIVHPDTYTHLEKLTHSYKKILQLMLFADIITLNKPHIITTHTHAHIPDKTSCVYLRVTNADAATCSQCSRCVSRWYVQIVAQKQCLFKNSTLTLIDQLFALSNTNCKYQNNYNKSERRILLLERSTTKHCLSTFRETTWAHITNTCCSTDVFRRNF